MDVAYNQHSIRRKSRSSVNLSHLSLAPLTSRLPIRDSDECDLSPTSAPSQITTYSYLQGKSAPTTPRLLSRSPGPTTARSASLSRQRGTDNRGVGNLLKSKSAVHLVTPRTSHYNGRHAASQNTSPTAARRSGTHPHRLTKEERSDSDWLLRCGSIISTETRESKGQAWLVSRASSTSLAGMPNAEEEAFERELAREREELNGYQSHTHSRHASRRSSRRNSIHMDDDNLSSPAYSRFGSRSHSRVGSMNPGGLNSAGVEGRRSAVFIEDYFNSNRTTPTGIAEEDNDAESIAGPDFVNLDEELEAAAEEDNGVDDEAYVRKLVKGGNGGMGSWFGNVLGVKLFAVEEDGEESEEDEDTTTEGEDEAAIRDRRVSSLRKLEAANMADIDTSIPPPKPDEGGWHDAAWLLTLASKVLL